MSLNYLKNEKKIEKYLPKGYGIPFLINIYLRKFLKVLKTFLYTYFLISKSNIGSSGSFVPNSSIKIDILVTWIILREPFSINRRCFFNQRYRWRSGSERDRWKGHKLHKSKKDWDKKQNRAKLSIRQVECNNELRGLAFIVITREGWNHSRHVRAPEDHINNQWYALIHFT